MQLACSSGVSASRPSAPAPRSRASGLRPLCGTWIFVPPTLTGPGHPAYFIHTEFSRIHICSCHCVLKSAMTPCCWNNKIQAPWHVSWQGTDAHSQAAQRGGCQQPGSTHKSEAGPEKAQDMKHQGSRQLAARVYHLLQRRRGRGWRRLV